MIALINKKNSTLFIGIIVFLFIFSIRVNAQTPILKEGFPISFTSHPGFTSLDGPVAADIDADGELEIVTNLVNKMYVINSDGTYADGFPVTITHVMQHSPAVGDLDGDGSLEIVAQARNANINETYVYAWHSDGTVVSGFPVTFGDGFYESPVLYDLDGDGKLEILSSFGNFIYVLDGSGNPMPGWPVEVGHINNTRPGIGDVDGDGFADVIVGTYKIDADMDEESGKLYAINFAGEILAGFPVEADSGLGFHRSDPVLADFNGDGVLDIGVVMTSFWTSFISRTAVFDGGGNLLSKWDTGYFGSRLSVADLDSDGSLDILTWSVDSIYAYNIFNGMIKGWPIEIDENLLNYNGYEGAVGNIDSSEGYEIIQGSSATRSDTSWVWGYSSDGLSMPWSPLILFGFQLSVALLTDLEGDGIVDMIRTSNTHITEEFLIYAFEVPGSNYDPDEFPWPMYGHDRYHTGQYGFVPTDSVIISVDDGPDHPILSEFELYQNYPNPFNSSTIIEYYLPHRGRVKLTIYNLLGEEVDQLDDGMMSPGIHSTNWNAGNLPTGLYFSKLTINNVSVTKKMLYLK